MPLLCLPLSSWPQEQDSLSRFQRVVMALEDAPAAWRSEFAIAAVSQLIDAYRTEVDLALSEMERDDFKLQRWTRTVDQFADQLFPLLADAEHELPVSLTQEVGPTVILTVDERRVILSHPRPSQQPVFEYRVLEQFCNAIPCEQLLKAPAAASQAQYKAAVTSHQWQFTADSRICIYDGVRIVFSTDVDVAIMRDTCSRFFREISDVLGEISRQVNRSVRVEWKHLRIDLTPDGRQYLLQLNRAGDASPLVAPILFRHPDALQAVIPWLSAKLSSAEAVVELDYAQIRTEGGG